MTVRHDEDLHIEACAVRAWPALDVQESDGWLLRATPGVDRRRSNSAVPTAVGSAGPLDSVEAFYRRWDRDVLVQVTPAHRHEELDARLASLGYEVEAPTLVLRTPLPARSRRARGWFHVEHGDRDRLWTRASDVISGRADASGELVIDRIQGRTTFVRALRDGEVVGVGAAVLDDADPGAPTLGIFGMGTADHCRRNGVAGAVLSALLRWGLDAGATSAWLQVEDSNHAARTLYTTRGFVESHRYHYRRRTG